MYYIYDDLIAFMETKENGVLTYAFPKAERMAKEMLSIAKGRYSYAMSLPRQPEDTLKKFKGSIALKYGQDRPEDPDTIESLQVPSIYFILGPTFPTYAVTKEKFDNFIQSLKEYEEVQARRQHEISLMSYGDLLDYFINHKILPSKKDSLMLAISNLAATTVGPDIETQMTGRQALEAAYYVLKGIDETGDESTLNDLILLGAKDSKVEYTQTEE